MRCRVVDLRCKEVINICDGKRLGFPYDVELDAVTGHLVSIIVKGPPKYWGLFGKCKEHVVRWCDIRKIGEDLVIVEHEHKDGHKHGKSDLKHDLKRELLKEIIG